MNKGKKPFIINLLIFTVITIVIWIMYSIYIAISSPAVINVPESALQSFDPTLDVEGLTKLQQSIYLSEEELEESVTTITIPEDTETEVATDETESSDISDAETNPANEETQP